MSPADLVAIRTRLSWYEDSKGKGKPRGTKGQDRNAVVKELLESDLPRVLALLERIGRQRPDLLAL